MELVDEYLLDEILATIYAAKFHHDSSKLTLKSVRDSIKKNFSDTAHPDASVELIIDKLETDGYIVVDRDEGSILLTDEGKKFILNNEGYSHIAAKREEETKIRQESIRQLKRGKWSFILSIIATILSIVALIYTFIKGH